jgi:NAD(P)-dependent dehydrogenase (short-subunit alcohol dehydrogenase family)
LAGDGHAVYIVDASQAAATAVASRVADAGGEGAGVRLDITDADGVRALVNRIEVEHGHLDVLVNCAALSGVDVKADLLDVTAEAWRRVIDVNLTGAFLMSQAAARLMAQRGSGCIVNISSVAGIVAEERAVGYSAAKAGLLGLTRAMALDLAALGIRVCAIAPGDITTATSRAASATEHPRTYPKRSPLGSGLPSDIAEAVAFLVGESGRFITGSTLVVDGGLTTY